MNRIFYDDLHKKISFKEAADFLGLTEHQFQHKIYKYFKIKKNDLMKNFKDQENQEEKK